MPPAAPADMHEGCAAKGSPVDASVNVWLQRFAAFDAREEEVIDQSSAYRALLREQARDQGLEDGLAATQPTERRKFHKPAL
jgi:hypothetical protein